MLRRELHGLVKPLAEDMSHWHNLPVDRAESTGNTRLQIRQQDDAESGRVTEVLAEGAVTIHSKFTIESPVPADVKQITALRIDALVQRRGVGTPHAGDGICIVAIEGGHPARGRRTARGTGIQARVLRRSGAAAGSGRFAE